MPPQLQKCAPFKPSWFFMVKFYCRKMWMVHLSSDDLTEKVDCIVSVSHYISAFWIDWICTVDFVWQMELDFTIKRGCLGCFAISLQIMVNFLVFQRRLNVLLAYSARNFTLTAHVNRDEQGFDRYLAAQGWFDHIHWLYTDNACCC